MYISYRNILTADRPKLLFEIFVIRNHSYGTAEVYVMYMSCFWFMLELSTTLELWWPLMMLSPC